LERINLLPYSDGAQLDVRPTRKDAGRRVPWAVKSSSLAAVTKGPSSFASTRPPKAGVSPWASLETGVCS